MGLPRVPTGFLFAEPFAELIRLSRAQPALAGELNRAEIDGRYLHWEELRRRPAPSGVSHETWWYAVKLARHQQIHPLPLTDSRGRPFSFTMTSTAQRLVHEIDRDASGRIEVAEDIANQSTRDRYVVSSLVEESIRSSQLEGASTTRAVAKEMLRTKREPRTAGERMILNNFLAMEWVREQKNKPFTAAAVFELHAIVTRDTLDVEDAVGRFRRENEDVHVVDNDSGDVVHTPPPAGELPARMELLCRFANGTSSDEPFIHPVARAILVHFWLAYDHPFVDGNGRTARALFYWSMLNQGYWLTEFISISRAIKKASGQYARAFVFSETDDNDTTYFLFNQLKVLRTAIDDLHAYLERKTREVRDVEARLRGRDDLNHRQIAVLAYALRHPDARLTIEAHQTSHRVVYQTARTDLLKLADAGFVEVSKVGNKMIFTPVRDLDRKLQSRSRR
jgi:Fic family protein